MKSFCPHKVVAESYWPTYHELRDFNSKWREAGFSYDLGVSGVFTGSKLTYMAFPLSIAKRLSAEIGRPCRVIDLGSGAGSAGFYFAKAGCDVVGIEKNGRRHELSQLHLERFKQAGILANKTPLKFLHADIFPSGFKANRCFVGRSDVFAAQLAPTSVWRVHVTYRTSSINGPTCFIIFRLKQLIIYCACSLSRPSLERFYI
jgi:SAM-dependent methyltransferase